MAKPNGVAVTAVTDPVQLVQMARAHWKKVVRRLPAQLQIRWLRTPEARLALGEVSCRDRIAELESREHAGRLAAAAALYPAWTDQHERDGVLPPGLKVELVLVRDTGKRRHGATGTAFGFEALGRRAKDNKPRHNKPRHRLALVADDEPERVRIGAARLVLSRQGVRAGMQHPPGEGHQAGPIAGVATRRWTPPQGVELEDFLDAQDWLEALYYPHPASVSAIAIERIGQMRARPVDGNW